MHCPFSMSQESLVDVAERGGPWGGCPFMPDVFEQIQSDSTASSAQKAETPHTLEKHHTLW